MDIQEHLTGKGIYGSLVHHCTGWAGFRTDNYIQQRSLDFNSNIRI